MVNRFAAAFLVFIFGISVSCGRLSDPKIPKGINGATPEISRGGMPLAPSGVVEERGLYARIAQKQAFRLKRSASR
jgi:hypothetical protein